MFQFINLICRRNCGHFFDSRRLHHFDTKHPVNKATKKSDKNHSQINTCIAKQETPSEQKLTPSEHIVDVNLHEKCAHSVHKGLESFSKFSSDAPIYLEQEEIELIEFWRNLGKERRYIIRKLGIIPDTIFQAIKSILNVFDIV